MSALRNHIIVGDALEQLRDVESSSVDMALTSPAYFRLRDYGVDGQLGLEASVDQWVANLVAVSREIQRVLVPTGTYWLNLGDTYSTHASQGAARKSLLMAPERLALALVADGWVLRNKVVWRKTNSMPSSVRDRLTCKWEAIYVFAKQDHYFFDLDAIREPHTSRPPKPHAYRGPIKREAWRGPNGGDAPGLDRLKALGRAGHPLGKNPGDIITWPSSNYRGAHHATFPVGLIERLIRAGSPEARCSRCRQPWQRGVLRSVNGTARRTPLGPTCSCGVASEAAIVLDPFFGAGSTALAARQLGRDWLGIELHPDYAALARERLNGDGPPQVANPPPAA
jgi:DNA modification methylase